MQIVVPGDLLPAACQTAYAYTHDGNQYATIIGQVSEDGTTLHPKTDRSRSAVPMPGQVVYCRVTKVTPRFAGVDIIGIAHSSTPSQYSPLKLSFKATIRQQDIYSVDEREQATVYECFKPTDIVRAQVIGLGDTSTGLLLSTGITPELGVVLGKSAHNGLLKAVAWNEMVCSLSGAVEKRKVARPASD